MDSIWMGIAPGPTATRVLAMHGASETILKARLRRDPAHPRAQHSVEIFFFREALEGCLLLGRQPFVHEHLVGGVGAKDQPAERPNPANRMDGLVGALVHSAFSAPALRSNPRGGWSFSLSSPLTSAERARSTAARWARRNSSDSTIFASSMRS